MEADALRKQLSVASQAAIQADADVSARLQACLIEEREQAVLDRQSLLSQITDLVNKSGEQQDARWVSKIDNIRSNIASSTSKFRTADKLYSEGMDVWAQKENLLVEEVLKSRDTLKGKMKKDWNVSCITLPLLKCILTETQAVNEHNTSIQTTTKSVHEETVRIVDAQMKDMAVQMQALDDFVTRARSQNERHHETHVRSLEGMASTIRQSYTSMGDHFESTYSRVRDLGADMADRSTALQNALSPLNSTLCQPLSDLRANITNAPLREYTPTGETPSKATYTYPTTLPRTEAHNTLLAKLAKGPRPTSSLSADVSMSPTLPSPTKSIIYTDAAAAAPAAADDIVLIQPIDQTHHNPGLREVHININAALPALRTSDPLIAQAQETLMPPPLKRHATMESKLPQKFGAKGGMRAEGRENSALGLGPGAGRRLRSSPSG